MHPVVCPGLSLDRHLGGYGERVTAFDLEEKRLAFGSLVADLIQLLKI